MKQKLSLLLFAVFFMAIAGFSSLQAQSVKVYAGADGQAGTDDGTLAEARFNQPWGIVYHNNCLYVAEWSGAKVRKIDIATGEVTTLLPTGIIAFPRGIAVDDAGNVLVTDYTNHKLFKIAPNGEYEVLAEGIQQPTGVAVGADGNYYVASRGGHSIVKVTVDGETSVFYNGGWDDPDPYHITAAPQGGFYATIMSHSDICYFPADGSEFSHVGFSPAASVVAGAVDASGAVYCIEQSGVVRKSVDGNVSLVADYGAGQAGIPYQLTVSPDGKTVYVANTSNHTIVSIDTEHPDQAPGDPEFTIVDSNPYTQSGIYKDFAKTGVSGSQWNQDKGWLLYRIDMPKAGVIRVTDKESPTTNLWWRLYNTRTKAISETGDNLIDDYDGTLTANVGAGSYYLVGITNYGFSSDYTADENAPFETSITVNPFKSLTAASLPYTETGDKVESSENYFIHADDGGFKDALIYEVSFDKQTNVSIEPGNSLTAYVYENIRTGDAPWQKGSSHQTIDFTAAANRTYYIVLVGSKTAAYSVKISKSDHSYTQITLPFAGSGKFADEAVSVLGNLDDMFKPMLAWEITVSSEGELVLTDNIPGPCEGDSYYYFYVWDNEEKAGTSDVAAEFGGSSSFYVHPGKYWIAAIPHKWDSAFDKTLDELEYDITLSEPVWSIDYYGGTPYPMAEGPHPLPGVVEMENFDNGGQDIAWHDIDLGLPGPGTGMNELYGRVIDELGNEIDVEVENYQEEEPDNFKVAWIRAGEWYNYTCEVAEEGYYDFHFKLGVANTPRITLKINGELVGQELKPESNGTGQQFSVTETSIFYGVKLPAGKVVVTFVCLESGGFNADNFEAIWSEDQGGAIKSVGDTSKPVKSIRYFDLLGRQLRSNATGFVIKQITYTDGSTVAQKAFIRADR
jgi:sugar lactone lactonase YvrE